MTELAPFADIENMLSETTMGMLANVVVQANGATFGAMLDVTDRTAYDTVTIGDYSLRYLTADVRIEQGDEVTVSAGPLAGSYAVAEPPQRINGHESVAGLVRA